LPRHAVIGYLAVPALLCCNLGSTTREDSMSKLAVAAVLGIMLAMGAQAQTTQQSKMTACNKDAADMKSAERRPS
jgi:hypothetical protein